MPNTYSRQISPTTPDISLPPAVWINKHVPHVVVRNYT